eukprot:scaffold647901_cov35-Prasinocladus_malaysianus.AAC.3
MFFRTSFNGYSLQFSPFEEGKIAVATSQNFGIIGNGRQYVLQVNITSTYACYVYDREPYATIHNHEAMLKGTQRFSNHGA